MREAEFDGAGFGELRDLGFGETHRQRPRMRVLIEFLRKR